MTALQEQITLQEPSKYNQEEQIGSGNTNTQLKNQKEESQYFYRLLITQLIIIFISTFLLSNKWFFYMKYTPKSKVNFHTYCETYGRCQQTYEYPNQYNNQQDILNNGGSQENTVYTNLYYCSFIMYPLFLILQSVFRNYQLFKKRQRLFHYLSYPLMSLFIQVCTHQISQTRWYIGFDYFRLLLIYLIGNVSFFYLNQKYFKWQLEIKSTAQKFLNYSIIIISLKGILDFISFNSSNYIPHLLLAFYIQVYLLHLNKNLFEQNNKYIIHNQSLLCLTINRLKSLFDVQDVYKQVAETHFVISSKMMKNGIIGIIIALILRDFLFSNFTLFVLSGFLLILVWDTSLVSTSSKLTLKDQYQAASLFFLDILIPIRNIILVLLA
ncbi:unnamed protein product [Paramecium pentaurelia]|uniref:Transmembrane protein n=1 Tax=Paramecium pentaurelia TaxID=43138 RepID=A0A8S1UWZ2_9CILI|nr:unnamed protein product [Paramecium pentaurelia]